MARPFPSAGSLASGTGLIVTVLLFTFVALTIGAVGLVYLILETISLSSARAAINSKYFRYAGWARIIATCGVGGLMIFVILVALLPFAGSVTPSGSVASTTPDLSLTRALGAGVAFLLLVWAVLDVFAALGFRDSQVAVLVATAPLNPA